MLGHIRLGQRVMLGFIFVLGLLLAVSFIGRYVMAGAIDRVDKANALNSLITDILQARSDENAFIQNETTSNIRSVLTRISRLRVQATSLKAKFEEAENINQIELVEKKIVEFLKSFLTFVNTIRLEKEVIFYMQQTSNLIIQHTKQIGHYLGNKLSEKPATGQNRLQHTETVKETPSDSLNQTASLDQADLYTAEAKKIKAFEDLIAESAIFKQTDTRLESMRYPGFYERKIISLLPAMTHLKKMVTHPDMQKTIEENILFINRYRHMMMVFNNLNQKQVNEHRRMTTAADEMHQVCSSVSREQDDIVKTKIAFAHRMSLMFIMGGALMGLLIGLVVTVSTSKAVSKIRAVEKALRQSDERFELVLEATTDGVWDWDVPSDKAYCSPTYYAMLGYRDGEIQPQTWKALWLDLIHPDDRQVAMQTVQAHIDVTTAMSLNFVWRKKAVAISGSMIGGASPSEIHRENPSGWSAHWLTSRDESRWRRI